jgi:tRNA A37 threonylcarbamoyladenosine biosynthesis protein TsaE
MQATAPIDVSVNAPTEAIQALMQAITAQLEAQYQARLSGKDDLIAGKDELIRGCAAGLMSQNTN